MKVVKKTVKRKKTPKMKIGKVKKMMPGKFDLFTKMVKKRGKK